MCDLQTLQNEADIVCLHIPLDEGNRKIINFEYINKFKKSFILLNIARGEILDHAALVDAMQIGKIKAACLDVLENEKLATFNEAEKMRFDYLVQSKKVLFSPHVAGWTFESYQKISEVLADKILAFYGDNHNF
jgi:D-3-phosphoglycerate dehydrogenase